MPMINVDIPGELRIAVKRYALDNGITMRDAVQRALRALVGCAELQPSDNASETPATGDVAATDIGGDTPQGVSFED